MQCSIIISLLKASLQLYWVDRQTESPAISISNSTLFPHPFYASFFSQKLNNHTLSPIHTPLGPSYSRINNGGKVMKVYKRMRANGITPNAYTYGVLIQALSKDPNFLGGAKKYLLKMLDKGLRPNFETYSAVIAAFAQAEKFEECLEILKRMQANGFDLEEEIVKGGKMCEEALERKRK